MEEKCERDLLSNFCLTTPYIVESGITGSLPASVHSRLHARTHTDPSAGMGSNTRSFRVTNSFTSTRQTFSSARTEQSYVRAECTAGETCQETHDRGKYPSHRWLELESSLFNNALFKWRPPVKPAVRPRVVNKAVAAVQCFLCREHRIKVICQRLQ